MREKSVRNYYMNLNGFVYDPFEKGGSTYIRVANLHNETGRAVLCIVNGNAYLVSNSMSEEELLQAWRDLPRNVDIILEGMQSNGRE